MRIVYKKLNGIASDLRFADAAYVLAANELETQGDVLPSPDSLTDPAVLDARAADATRLSGVDGTIATNTFGAVAPKTIPELKAMSASEYSAWFDQNVTSAAQAIGVLKRLTLVIIRRLL
jgi:hypothetical protein